MCLVKQKLRKEDLKFVPVTDNNIQDLIDINNNVLPIQFDYDWYKESLAVSSGNILQLVYLGNEPIGGIKSRILSPRGRVSPLYIYIDTIAVMSQYRKIGVGKMLMSWLIRIAREKFIRIIRLHCMESYIDYYTSAGFKKVGVVPKYYEKYGLGESTGYLMQLDI